MPVSRWRSPHQSKNPNEQSRINPTVVLEVIKTVVKDNGILADAHNASIFQGQQVDYKAAAGLESSSVINLCCCFVSTYSV